MGSTSEKALPDPDGLGVPHQPPPHHTRHLGLNSVHDFHRFDDAHHLPRRHATARLDVGRGARLRSAVKRAHHGRLDLEQLGRGSRVPPPPAPPPPPHPPLPGGPPPPGTRRAPPRPA